MARALSRLAFWGVSALALTAFLPAAVQACAVCIGGDANDPLADAFNWSVLFMMASPYVIFGTIGGWIFYRQRYRDGAEDDAADRYNANSDFDREGEPENE
ncbi:MAG TPA: hypothetical protein VNL14_13080 [Candidatus Acidoferrales bacterium]|nr:hypothetical protein [Candidatus Acidoferrales bacterium]